MKMIMAIALGGALGAVSRHFVAGAIFRVFGPGFPWGIMSVNIIGSFFMGVLVEAFALKFDPTPELRGFLTVGLLGAFTTFSTFSLETVLLFERGHLLQAAGYITGSVALGVFGLVAGMWLGKIVL